MYSITLHFDGNNMNNCPTVIYCSFFFYFNFKSGCGLRDGDWARSEEMEPEEVARLALCQETSVTFLAHVLRENLGEVLREMPVFPVMKGFLHLGWVQSRLGFGQKCYFYHRIQR